METETPTPFSDSVDESARGYEADMDFVFWRPGRMMAIFLAALSASFVTRYPEYRMGRNFSGSGCMFLQTNKKIPRAS